MKNDKTNITQQTLQFKEVKLTTEQRSRLTCDPGVVIPGLIEPGQRRV